MRPAEEVEGNVGDEGFGLATLTRCEVVKCFPSIANFPIAVVPDSPKPMTKSKGTQQAAPIRESTSSIHSTHSLTSKDKNSKS